MLLDPSEIMLEINTEKQVLTKWTRILIYE